MCHDTDCGCAKHDLGSSEGRGYQHGDCCCAIGHGRKRFFTREEAVSELEEYLNSLSLETRMIEERIAELKKDKKEL